MSPGKVKGFTVFEIMVTVVIVAIISAFAIPGFQDLRVKGRLNAAAQEASSALQLARNTAIVRRRTVILQPVSATSSWGNGWDMWMDTVTTGVRLNSSTIAAPATLLVWQGSTQTDTVQQITFGVAGQVQRTAPGAATPLSMTIRICDSSVADEVGRDVTMNAIGRIVVTQHSSKSVCNP